jgi:hypothetical protein
LTGLPFDYRLSRVLFPDIGRAVLNRRTRLQIANKGGQIFNKRTAKIAASDSWPAERDASEWIGLLKEVNHATEQA